MALLRTYPAYLSCYPGYVFGNRWYTRRGGYWNYYIGPGGDPSDYTPIGVFITHDGIAERPLVFGSDGRVCRAAAGGYSWQKLWTAPADKQLVQMWYDALHKKLIGVGRTGNIYDIANVWTGKMTKVGETPYDPSTWGNPYDMANPQGGTQGWRCNDYCMDAKGRIHCVHRTEDLASTEYLFSDTHGATWGDSRAIQYAGDNADPDPAISAMAAEARTEEQHLACHGDTVHVTMGLHYAWASDPPAFPQPAWEYDPFIFHRYERQLYEVVHLYSMDRGETWARQRLYRGLRFWHGTYAADIVFLQWSVRLLEEESGNAPGYSGTPGVMWSGTGRTSCTASQNRVIISYCLATGTQPICEVDNPAVNGAAAEVATASTTEIKQSSRNWMGGDGALTMHGGGLGSAWYPHEASKLYWYDPTGSSEYRTISDSYFYFYIPQSVQWPQRSLQAQASGYSFWW